MARVSRTRIRSRIPTIAGVLAFVVVLLTAYGDGRDGMGILLNSAVVGVLVYFGTFVLMRRRR